MVITTGYTVTNAIQQVKWCTKATAIQIVQLQDLTYTHGTTSALACKLLAV